MTASVTMDVLARDRASATLNRVGGAAEHNSGRLRHFGASLAGIFTGAALYEGADKLIEFLKTSGEAAATNEEDLRRMALQFKNSAHATDTQVTSTQAWITAQENAFGVSDTELIPALTRMVTATHGVKQAQNEVSLAMNIAAGTGKSLSTVTAALQKGYNGSVGGLSRLGVATKDAAGNTLSFDQIQKNLAQTFKGQAADAADTTAGKYRELGIKMHELEITIGQKLLPIGLELGNWMLDKGIPAAEQLGTQVGDKLAPDMQKLSHWFDQNKGSLEQFAQTAGGEALTVLQDLASVTGTVVGWFEKLPDPVKHAGVEVVIAAAAFGKLSAMMGGVPLPQMISNLRNAETRTQGYGQAARAAAGAGGLALLIDSTQRSNAALSTLETTAGAAAVGFSVGGPWGAAIGGAGGLVYSLGTKFGTTRTQAENAYAAIRSTDSVKAAVAELSTLKGTLDQVSGAYTDATRAAVLQKLQQNGLVATAAKYGFSQRELVSAAMGQHQALASLNPIIAGYVDQVSNADKKLAALKATTSSYYTVSSGGHVVGRVMTDDALKQATALEAQKSAARKAMYELEAMGVTLGKDAKQIQQNSAATADYTGKLKGIPAAARTEILADGLLPTARGIADLTTKYNLTPKQVRTLIQASGADTSLKAVEALTHAINLVPTSHTTTFHTVYDTKHLGPTGNPQAASAGGAGRTSAGGPGVDPLGFALRGLGRNSDGTPNSHHHQLTDAAEHLLADLVPGIQKGKVKLDKALAEVEKTLQNRRQNYQDVLSQYNTLAAGFAGFETSIFSTQGTTDANGNPVAASLAAILSQSSLNATTATQLNADVQRLIGEGLSKALIAQMESEGASGQANIHTLAAQATPDQIAALNASESTTESQYAAAGTAVAQALEGPQVKAAEAAVKQAQTLDKILKSLDDGFKQNQTIVVTINGSTIVSAVATHKKHHPDATP